jgi:hypothetical protein
MATYRDEALARERDGKGFALTKVASDTSSYEKKTALSAPLNHAASGAERWGLFVLPRYGPPSK